MTLCPHCKSSRIVPNETGDRFHCLHCDSYFDKPRRDVVAELRNQLAAVTAERDAAMVKLGLHANSLLEETAVGYHDIFWLKEHGCVNENFTNLDYMRDCDNNLCYAIAEHLLEEGDGDGR
jgi:hypothetical protein